MSCDTENNITKLDQECIFKESIDHSLLYSRTCELLICHKFVCFLQFMLSRIFSTCMVVALYQVLNAKSFVSYDWISCPDGKKKKTKKSDCKLNVKTVFVEFFFRRYPWVFCK